MVISIVFKRNEKWKFKIFDLMRKIENIVEIIKNIYMFVSLNDKSIKYIKIKE